MVTYAIIGVIALLTVVIVVSIIGFISRNYIKVAPNEVVVFYGRKYKAADGTEIGFKVVTGGARLKIPIIESTLRLPLTVMSIDLQVQNAPNKDGVPVSLRGVANVKLLSDEESLRASAERFLGMNQQQIEALAYKNLEGHLRSIAGVMSVEELVNDRTKLNQAVLADAAADLKKLGLGIDLLTIQEVTDNMGYIDQLGKRRTAEVVRDAEVGKAEAEKESKIKTTTALKDGVEKENENLILIAESNKNRDVQKQVYFAEVEKQAATAQQAGPLAKAQAEKAVVEAEQEVKIAQTKKQQELATEEAIRKEKELLATVVKPAEAAKLAKVATAEADKTAIVLASEADRQKKINEGEGTAKAIEANLLAEAAGIKAKLVAEAEGIEKKAEAYSKLDEAGKFLLILEAVERIAPAVVREFAGVMEAAAKPFESIDSVQIIDFGGNGAGGSKSALSNFGQVAPEMIFKFIAAAQGAGIDVQGLLAKAGIDMSKFVGNKKGLPEGNTETTIESTPTVEEEKK